MSPEKESQNDIALLGAFCLFLSAIEYLIPKPLPFIRLGLANLPLLLALDFQLKPCLFLTAINIMGQALISGTLLSYVFLFSVAGSISSALVMFVTRRFISRKLIGFTGISIAGAVFSTLSQLFFARYFILGSGTVFIAPPFLAAGIITGAALGIFCELFTAKSVWYKNLKNSFCYTGKPANDNALCAVSAPLEDKFFAAKKTSVLNCVPAIDLFICGIVMAVLVLYNSSTEIKLIQFAMLWISAVLLKRNGKLFYTFLFFFSIVAINLFPPYGKILFEAGYLRITSGALDNALNKAATVQALFFISRITIKSDLVLPGTTGKLLSRSFYILEKINCYKKRISKNVIADIDALMLTLSAENVVNSSENQNKTCIKQQRSIKSALILCAVLAVPALPVLFKHLNP
ncbi:MAG: Gx transporter family protein [Spirochaetaceae bacterium]|nr:Gx transporter family protein [Spirochaetaceae bacterium]